MIKKALLKYVLINFLGILISFVIFLMSVPKLVNFFMVILALWYLLFLIALFFLAILLYRFFYKQQISLLGYKLITITSLIITLGLTMFIVIRNK